VSFYVIEKSEVREKLEALIAEAIENRPNNPQMAKVSKTCSHGEKIDLCFKRTTEDPLMSMFLGSLTAAARIGLTIEDLVEAAYEHYAVKEVRSE